MKPGYKTSEFWLTLLVAVVSALVNLGIIPLKDQAMLDSATSKIVAGIVATISVARYIHSRQIVKSCSKIAPALLGLLLFSGTASAVDLKLPSTVAGDLSDFIAVKAETTGPVVKWVSLDSGLKLFPPDLLKDTKTAVVLSATAGSYRLLAYTADASGPSDPALTTVMVGNPPTPVPVPGPAPSDAFFKSLQAAYTANTDAAKAKYRDALAAIYRDAPIADNSLKTAADLLQRLQVARKNVLPDTALLEERKVIALELDSILPLRPDTPLDQAARAATRKEFDKVAQYLQLLK